MKKRKQKTRGSGPGGPKRAYRTLAYPVEFRLRMVKLYLEEGYSASMLREQFDVSGHSIHRWAKAYRLHGAEGLEPKRRVATKSRVPAEVRRKVVGLKQAHPEYGARRIVDVLKRFFLIRTSPATVHKTLSEEGLVQKAKRRPQKNPPKPRFFERARPNQMWQSDIMTFRLGGRNAYLIGFLDDYSRYVTSLGLYRSQTAEHVLETYRRGVAEYGVPREMLTDNGRQYTNWRGKTRFEREMKKDRIRHIRSRPHHPMTLGKIERFWKSILGEFLQRAQFDSFQQAVERTALWTQYYNHKRPHQGIGGLCPADRFFEIAHDLKQTLEKGIEENVLELALRGRPADPFYMVGRMGEQSVVIRAEKGKVKMLVDGAEAGGEKELVYDARKDIDDEDNPANPQDIRAAAEDNGSAVDLERTAHDGTGLPGDGHQPDLAGPVAEPGHRGNAQSLGPDEEGSGGAAQPPAGAADRKEAGRAQQPAGEAACDDPEGEKKRRCIDEDGCHGKTYHFVAASAIESRGDHEGALRSDDRAAGGGSVGSLSQDLLQVGAAGVERTARWGGRESPWPSGPSLRRSAPGPGAAAERSETADRASEPQAGAKGCAVGDEAASARLRPGEKKMSSSDRCWP
jgi:transposase InsO family protein